MAPFLFFITVTLAGKVLASVNNGLSRLEKRGIDCSDSTQQSFAAAAFTESNTLAGLATNYINQHGTSDPVYISYFGSQDMQSTLSGFAAVSQDTSITVRCSDPTSVCPKIDIKAYNLGGSDTNVFLCPSFYTQATTASLCSGTSVDSNNIRGGTMLSTVAFTLAVAGGSPIGCSAARAGASSPQLNIDNYSCFAMQVFADTQCS